MLAQPTGLGMMGWFAWRKKRHSRESRSRCGLAPQAHSESLTMEEGRRVASNIEKQPSAEAQGRMIFC